MKTDRKLWMSGNSKKGQLISLRSKTRNKAQIKKLRILENDDKGQFIKLGDNIRKKAPVKPVKPARLQRGMEKLGGNRYKLMRVLGEGGTGIVYEAKDLLLNMPVAVKILNPRLSNNKAAISALKEETRLVMQLSHTHIVRLHNLQKIGGNYLLIMEYVDGHTFHDILQLYGPLAPDTVVQAVNACSHAVSYAHRHGVLHNDLKPDHLVLTKDRVLKIIDFGISCLISSQRDTGIITGTPAYMSPEQKRGEKLDARTDVYALGITTYELLTDKTPFPENTSVRDLLVMEPEELSGLPEEITSVIEKAIAANRDDRWASAADFAIALSDAVASVA